MSCPEDSEAVRLAQLLEDDENPALSDAAEALLHHLIDAHESGQAFRVGIAYAACIDALVAPDEEMLRAAAAAETTWDARAIAAEYVQKRRMGL